MEYLSILEEACRDIGLELTKEQYEQFMKYKDLIQEWNKKVNLTSIKEDEEIVKKHFIDSIKIFKFEEVKNAKRIIDIGTGGGFPGIPMKIVNPDCEMVLLDSLNKRINFLNIVINDLGLKKISTIHGRAEDFAVKSEYREKFDLVVSRAVANMTVLSEFCLPYVDIGKHFVALKGPSVDEELNEAKRALSVLGGEVEKLIPVKIEDSDLEHNLVIIKKINNTPKQYPRKAGTANKKPLK
ncbi:16S rRNA (guanine(527)-N(7))-methyltransferase RsmG [Hathewaya massiliensis]|uniref:16S rRNA (guanine(527)-N(7))-methyltransferase RsmG n=1 Tax=Hathewaya massiliensis TaxID=1964382 RepID=UPI00115AA2E3|nr:16S rRNA (guanine(527)-N(7))-methyltransferase RsmG [Hathewaya massiliensis]